MEDSGFSAFLPNGMDAGGHGGTIVANDVDRLIDVIENGTGPTRPRTPMKSPSVEIDFEDDNDDDNDDDRSMSDIGHIGRNHAAADTDETGSIVSLRPDPSRQPPMDRETMMRTKQDLLYKLNRMRARGSPRAAVHYGVGLCRHQERV